MKRPKARRVRFVKLALIDEVGKRWDFDTGIGYTRRISEIVGRHAVCRVLLTTDRDVEEVDAVAVISAIISKPGSAGIYRSGDREIAVVFIDH